VLCMLRFSIISLLNVSVCYVLHLQGEPLSICTNHLLSSVYCVCYVFLSYLSYMFRCVMYSIFRENLLVFAQTICFLLCVVYVTLILLYSTTYTLSQIHSVFFTTIKTMFLLVILSAKILQYL
jgi:hypothetical protein